MVDGQHSEMLFLEKIYYEKYTKKSYSLTSVDLVIDYLFKNINKGVYIDLGCNHPIKFNNTYLLYKRGWSGINIDSDHDSIKLFNKFRINDFNVRNIVSDDENVKKLYFYQKIITKYQKTIRRFAPISPKIIQIISFDKFSL